MRAPAGPRRVTERAGAEAPPRREGAGPAGPGGGGGGGGAGSLRRVLGTAPRPARGSHPLRLPASQEGSGRAPGPRPGAVGWAGLSRLLPPVAFPSLSRAGPSPRPIDFQAGGARGAAGLCRGRRRARRCPPSPITWLGPA